MASAPLPAAPAWSLGDADPGGPLHVANLLGDLATLGPLLMRAIRAGNSLDAFLLAAGINQIAEDYLHDSFYALDQATSLLARSASPAGRLAGRVAAGAGLAARALKLGRSAGDRALAWQMQVAQLVAELGDVVVAGRAATGRDVQPASQPLLDRGRQLMVAIPSLPVALQRSVLRLPACFHDFDQRPEDLERLAERFADRQLPVRPLLVVGVRTSGNYLAPLLAAALRARYRGPVRAITIRPDRRLLAHERALVRAIVRSAGQVLLTDDPPVTGSSLVAAAGELERLGVSPRTVVLMLGVQEESGAMPPALRPYDAVVLPPRDWTVEARMNPEEVRSALAALLEGELELRSVRRLRLPGGERPRGHRRALFRVSGVSADGTPRRVDVLATSVGVGYLGAHHLVVARALSRFSPRVLGVRDCVLYREWLPAQRRLDPASDEFAAAVAGYVAARRRALGVARDVTVSLAGQRPAWEVVGLILARGFGRAAPLMRVVLVDRLVRRLLAVSRPSVVDGSMSPEHWFADGQDPRPVKVGLSDRSYWRLGLACFDPSFDLAGVAASSPSRGLAARVRAAWRAQTGEEVDPERWVLYELAHLWGVAREDPAREAEVQHASARAAARYFGATLFADVARTGQGPLCALDVDGVLETDQLGFPTLTRASATALRALVAHDYRPLIITGRGLAEVRDRCRAYGLAGGVAEYGSAIWLDATEAATGLIDPDAAAALSRLRATLLGREGVQLDPGYSYAVRAYRIDTGGHRRPLGDLEVADCLEASGCADAIRAIRGDSQTDFAAAGVDKGTGLRALMAALQEDEQGLPHEPALSMAVGDSVTDAPMLALASAAFVPAHAAQAATTTGAERLARPYQAGLYRAAGELLGHAPGSCERCKLPPATRERDLLLDLLSVAEDGPRAIAMAAVRLAWKAVT